MGTFKDLLAWQKSLTLAKKVYQVTGNFPTKERFGLVNQMRRCAVSIPSNIAEGYGRGSDKELLRFLYVALGSSNELETQLILSLELSFMKEEDSRMLQGLNTEVNKMILSLIYRRKNGLDKNSRT
ncbi:MAG TPA: four helix bundle protein [Candidatus Parabacteroides faecavium]|nr:four helix bundle protein [Candidatus Parabacteroides faecavium]